MDKSGTEKKKNIGIFFHGFADNEDAKPYPAWRYHKVFEAVIVKDTEEDELYQKRGYEKITSTFSGHKGFQNWFWDIEDMSAKQLVVFAKEEWNIDLPVEAGQERLQKAIFELAKWAPNNRDRIVFMAHEMKMDYDGVQGEIRRLAKEGMSEVETKVIEL